MLVPGSRKQVIRQLLPSIAARHTVHRLTTVATTLTAAKGFGKSVEPPPPPRSPSPAAKGAAGGAKGGEGGVKSWEKEYKVRCGDSCTVYVYRI